MVIVSGGFAPPPPRLLINICPGPGRNQKDLRSLVSLFVQAQWPFWTWPCTFASENTKIQTYCPVKKSCVVGLIASYQSTAKFSPWLQTIFSARAYTENVWIFTCLPVECWQQYWSDHSIMIARPRTLQPFSKPFKKRGYFFKNLAPINDFK